MLQVFPSAKAYGCTTIRVDSEPGGVGGGDVPGPSRMWA